MSLMFPTNKNTSDVWEQFTAGVNAKNDKLFSVQDLSQQGYFAYVDELSDTDLYVFKISADGQTVTSGTVITITTGSGDRLFMTLNRDQSTLYIGASNETTIWSFNTSNMSSRTNITTVDNSVQNMLIDKNGYLTVLSHNVANTEVDRYDTDSADNHDTNSSVLPIAKDYTAMYFLINNDLVVGSASTLTNLTVFSLAGSVYSTVINNGAYGKNLDISVDIYGNVVVLEEKGGSQDQVISRFDSSTLVKIWESPKFTIDSADVDLRGLSLDSSGNYYFSTVDPLDETDIQKQRIIKYNDDNNASSYDANNIEYIRTRTGTRCFGIGMVGYNVSGDGAQGR